MSNLSFFPLQSWNLKIDKSTSVDQRKIEHHKKLIFNREKYENNSTFKMYYKSHLEAIKRKLLAFYVFHKREIEL